MMLEDLQIRYRKIVGNMNGYNGWEYLYNPSLNRFIAKSTGPRPVIGGYSERILSELNNMLDEFDI